MPSTPRLALAALAAASAVGSAASAQAATTPVDPVTNATPVAAAGGTAMWSRLDAATGQYQLVESVGGAAPAVVPVAESPTAFDVDLGTSRQGSLYAVYSRGGDLYRLRVKGAVEEKLTKLSSPTLTESHPTISAGRIAFLREDGGTTQLRVGDTTTASKGSKLVLKSKTLQSAELGNLTQIAYVDRAGNKQRVHVRNTSTGHDQVVYQAASGGASFAVVTKPSYTGDGFLWASTRIGNYGSRLVKVTLRTGKLSYDKGSPRYASAAWIDEGRGVIVSTSLDAQDDGTNDCTDAGVQYCGVATTGPLAFDQSQP